MNTEMNYWRLPSSHISPLHDNLHEQTKVSFSWSKKQEPPLRHPVTRQPSWRKTNKQINKSTYKLMTMPLKLWFNPSWIHFFLFFDNQRSKQRLIKRENEFLRFVPPPRGRHRLKQIPPFGRRMAKENFEPWIIILRLHGTLLPW